MKIMDLASVVIDVEGVESRSFSSDANNNFRTADLHSSNGWSVEEVKRSKRRASFQTRRRNSKETLVVLALKMRMRKTSLTLINCFINYIFSFS